MDVRHKAVAKGVARSQIRRSKHDNYLQMYNGGALTNVVNRRIGSKLHHVYTMEQEMRGLCLYDDKRYLLADLPDGRQNPNTHAYGYCDLAAEEHLVADQPEPGAELIIRHQEERFTLRHALVTRRVKLADALDLEEELPDGDADGELNGNQLLVAKPVSAARPNGTIRMGDVLKRIIARDDPERPISPLAQMPEPPTPQRAILSGLNAHLPPFRRNIDSSDEDEPVRPVWPPRRPHLELVDGDYEQESDAEPEPPKPRKKARRRTNPFIDAEASVDGDASGDETAEHKNDYLDGFIVVDNV